MAGQWYEIKLAQDCFLKVILSGFEVYMKKPNYNSDFKKILVEIGMVKWEDVLCKYEVLLENP